MAAQQVQHGVQVLPGIVFRLVPVPAVRFPCIGPSQGKIKHQIPEHIVHHTVQFSPGQILALDPVAFLVGGILPHLPDQHRFRILLFQFPVETGEESVRQFIGHIQPPAADSRIHPVLQHAVPVPDDEIQVGGLRFRHFRQGMIPPPAGIVLPTVPELVPAIIRGIRSLPGPRLPIGPFPVEVPAVRSGVAEHPVQDDPHPMAPCFPAQGPEGLLRAQEGIDGFVVPGIVPVVAPGLENGVQVQAVHPQLLQVRQFFQDSLQGPSVKIVISYLAPFILHIAGIPFPSAVDQGPRLSLEPFCRYRSPAEPVREDLVHHRLFQPGRRHGIPVIHSNLVRGRLPVPQPAHASLPGLIVPVIQDPLPQTEDKIIPDQGSPVRHGKGHPVPAFPDFRPVRRLRFRLPAGHGQEDFPVVLPETQKNSFRPVALHRKMQGNGSPSGDRSKGKTASCLA